MNMLPNDHHPGPRCSCAECQRRYPELSEDAPTPATSKELISLRDVCKHRGKSENCLLCKSADQVYSLRSALNMAGDLLTNQRRPTLAQEAQIIAALSGDSGPVAAHEPLSALAEMEHHNPRSAMNERQPIPVTEIIVALEREAETETSPQWLAAQHLRRMKGWDTRTLMCQIDTRPSMYSTATKSGDAP